MQLAGKHVFAALWCFCSQLAIAQEYPFIKYTPKDGLASSRVQNFYQDASGRIFFMTADGLSLYDGARFLNYTVNDGLANPVINDVLEITADSILVATNTGTLNAWVKGAIKKITTRNGFCPVINKFHRSKDKLVYVATDQGLFRFDKDIFIPLPISYKKGELLKPLDQIEEIGNFFLLKEFDGSTMMHTLLLVNKKTLAISSLFANLHISSVLPVENGNLLLAVVNYKLLAFDLDAAENGILKQKELPDRYHLLKSYVLSKIFGDRANNIWAIARGGILCCSPNGQIQTFDKTNGLNHTNIFAIGVDRENILWILTDGSGVLKLVNKNVQIITGIDKSRTEFTDIYSGDSGNVWMFNAADGGIYCQNRKGLKRWQLDSLVLVRNISMRKGALLLFAENNIFEAKAVEEESTLLAQKYLSL